MRRISSHFGDPVQPESAVSPNDLVETARHVTATIEIVARLVRSQAPGRHKGGLCNGGRTDGPRNIPRSTAAENYFLGAQRRAAAAIFFLISLFGAAAASRDDAQRV